MKTTDSKDHLKAVVQQLTTDSTSWVGQLQGESRNRTSGQTFLCPTEGKLGAIEIFSTAVCNKASMDLTVHQFNTINKTWGPVLETSTIEIDKADADHWINFPLQGLRLEPGTTYGFRLNSHAGLIGIGEAIGSSAHLPTVGGQEWEASSDNRAEKYYSYFSLAFKVELRA